VSFFSRFRGGVHPHGHKNTAASATQPLPRPVHLVLPMRQHIGAPCKPLVKVGDQVALGQPIGDTDAAVAAPIHATASGKVIAVEPRLTPGGRMEMSVVLETAPEDTWWDGLPEGLTWQLDPQALSPETLRDRIRQAGIVGLGGAGFPTATKITPRSGAPVPDVVLLNGAECEPVLTSDHRLMLEEPAKVVLGLRLFMQATGARKGIIALEDNKMDAAEALRACLRGEADIAVEVLPARYPQGAEKMLVWACTGRAVPLGGFPLDVGVVVQNVATAAAVATALAEGKPLTERIVTVAGRVGQPGNWRAPIGTPFVDLVKACGDVDGPLAKVVAGGPMMGMPVPSLTVPVTKTTGGMILMSPADVAMPESGPCIRCGRCVAACPMGLLPAQLALIAETAHWEDAKRFHISACIECGSCSYSCPARRPIVQAVRLTKAELNRKAAAARG